MNSDVDFILISVFIKEDQIFKERPVVQCGL